MIKMLCATHARIFSTMKDTALTLTQRMMRNQRKFDAKLLSTASVARQSDSKSVHVTSVQSISTDEDVKPMTFTERILRKTGLIDVQKYKHMVLGYRVYEHIISQIDFPFFFKHFNMVDTYFSWFLIVELHVWMIMVRYMAEGKSGQLIRNNAVSAMWDDTNARVNKLGTITAKVKTAQIKELSHQFNAAIIGYDEGIQSDDKVLAGALWRRFFRLECNNPEHIEILVIYVRKQICLFDNLPTERILRRPILKLIDIKSLCKPQ